jgi:hypothetical protein
MWFEGRELTSHAQSVLRGDLQVGSVYFTVNFFDAEMTTPEISTLVYVGVTRIAEIAFQKPTIYDDGDIMVFQNAASYFDKTNSNFEKFTEDELAGVYEFEAALDVLLSCSLVRAKANLAT